VFQRGWEPVGDIQYVYHVLYLVVCTYICARRAANLVWCVFTPLVERSAASTDLRVDPGHRGAILMKGTSFDVV
jgi:hypothetical protein